ncbi:DsbA family protein [Marinobacter salarius]|uniref:2-hydroxychromene-2-carboxylate isomerase n=1 Tax=Marinobacter salarius TaxID=1420917 RepID=A0A1W6K449_9GAMM|nr:DsbA family protein [Marinobacter salarius]ARM82175.1 2-hydroxychromene-2-carboxylate isomerase [Marinobacter salarius]
MRRPVKADVMPWLARALSSAPRYALQRSLHNIRAKTRGESDLVQVFVNPRDPFGLPLLQALIQLQERFYVRFRVHTVWQLDDNMYPEPALWRTWAQQDATRLAQLYGFTPPDRPTAPSETELTTATARLLNAEKTGEGLITAVRVLEDLWHSHSGSPPDTAPARYDHAQLSENERLLRRLGHYQGSMTRYLGEWFWGVDRLDHLERRLNEQGLNRDVPDAVLFTRTWSDLMSSSPSPADGHRATTTLEVFFSIRSPYSYLGLERAVQLAKAWNIPLQLRPVLPMLMRGQSVPDAKKWYIFHDTKREANKLGIPYGFVADPLGPGVERCYALFEYARSLGRETDYMLAYARAVNAEGIRSETDAGLKVIVERAGLDWQKAKALLNDQSWREWAENNRKAMYDCGLWGVPSFRYGEVSCWGQDRLWVIEKSIVAATATLNKRQGRV